MLSLIVGGILTTESGWNAPFGTPFEASLGERASDERLDIDAGGFGAVYYEDDLQIRTSRQEYVLAFFFMRLLHKLQRIGTVPAIDYEVYLDAFEGQD